MRCNCCDRKMSDKEISWNKDLNTFEMCSECLEISLDAAFSEGFTPEDDRDSVPAIDSSFDEQDDETQWSNVFGRSYDGDD